MERTLTPAEKHYQNHLRNVSNYQKRNPEKMREKCKKYLDRLKEDPEKYKEYQQQKRQYYLNKKEKRESADQKIENI